MKLVSTLLFIFFLGCGGPSGDAEKYAETDNGMVAYEESPNIEFTEKSLKSDLSEVQEQKIIKTANLAFESQNLEETHKKIIGLVDQHKAIIQNDNSGKSYNRIFRNITVRVPSQNFHSFIDGVSEGVTYFDRRDISQQDVTEEFVDLQARLKAKRELEKRYLELLSQAKNVKEMLEIERELSNIREEIEAKQGRLQYLENRVSMSTISIEFYKHTAETGITQSYGQKMINALKGGWNGVSVFVLGLLYLWPVFVLAIVFILLLKRYLKHKKNNKQ